MIDLIDSDRRMRRPGGAPTGRIAHTSIRASLALPAYYTARHLLPALRHTGALRPAA